MARDRGQAFLLKLGDGEPASYVTVAGLKADEVRIETDNAAETRRFGGQGWRELLAGTGVRSVSVTAQGIFTGTTAEQAVRRHALDAAVEQYELSFESGDRMRGRFLVALLEYVGDFNGERTYRIRLESSGEVEAL